MELDLQSLVLQYVLSASCLYVLFPGYYSLVVLFCFLFCFQVQFRSKILSLNQQQRRLREGEYKTSLVLLLKWPLKVNGRFLLSLYRTSPHTACLLYCYLTLIILPVPISGALIVGRTSAKQRNYNKL